MAAIEQIAAELERVTTSLTEMEEEHGSEDGAFADFDKVNKANVTARLKELQSEGGLSGNAKPQLGINSRKAELGLGAPRRSQRSPGNSYSGALRCPPAHEKPSKKPSPPSSRTWTRRSPRWKQSWPKPASSSRA